MTVSRRARVLRDADEDWYSAEPEEHIWMRIRDRKYVRAVLAEDDRRARVAYLEHVERAAGLRE